jgi:ADP-heptose:LPS heptosyltransferase
MTKKLEIMESNILRLRRATEELKWAVRGFACAPLSGSVLKALVPRRIPPRAQDESTVRIAIISLIPYLGDLIFYLPLVDALREANQSARITFVGTSLASGILSSYPGLDEVLTLPAPERASLHNLPILRDYRRLREVAAFSQSVASTRQFDIALIPRGGADPTFSAHAAWLMNVPRIYGFSSHLEKEREYMHHGADAMFDSAVLQKKRLHESMRALEVGNLAGLISLDCWSESQPIRGLKELAEIQNFSELRAALGLQDERPYAIIAPGASIARRRWPPARFRQIAERLNREAGLTVLLIGAGNEGPLAEEIATGLEPQTRNITGELNLLQLICLLNRATLFLGNDSGPGHIAGALGVPTFSLNPYPANAKPDHHQSPARNRPIGPAVVVLQPTEFLSPCKTECISGNLHCLGQIQVEEVWDAIISASGVWEARIVEGIHRHS